jgi:hypothetical protein
MCTVHYIVHLQCTFSLSRTCQAHTYYVHTGRVWAAGFHHVTARSRLARGLKFTNLLFF